eukprot:TRINITY_DN5002_c0_g1_i1.p1 TRINITY_DN5002_c0_g1~~TRINITY_DN5002_c0_g1_i1.p1  ORF type:complete len:768 (-),score=147.37 TRINITY_DN5002_c0_g1_i1:749-2929(-)
MSTVDPMIAALSQHERAVTDQLRVDLLSTIDENNYLTGLLASETQRAQLLEQALRNSQTFEQQERDKRDTVLSKYRALRNDYESVCDRLVRNKRKLKQLQSTPSVSERERESQKMLDEISTYQARVSELETVLSTRDEEIAQLQIHAEDAQSIIKRATKQASDAVARLDVERKTLQETSSALVKARDSINRLQRTVHLEAAAKKKLGETVTELQAQVAAKENAVETALGTERKRLQQQIRGLEDERVRLQLKVSNLTGSLVRVDRTDLVAAVIDSASPLRSRRTSSVPRMLSRDTLNLLDRHKSELELYEQYRGQRFSVTKSLQPPTVTADAVIQTDPPVPPPRERPSEQVLQLQAQLSQLQMQHQNVVSRSQQQDRDLLAAQNRIRELSGSAHMAQDTATVLMQRNEKLLREMMQLRSAYGLPVQPPAIVAEMQSSGDITASPAKIAVGVGPLGPDEDSLKSPPQSIVRRVISPARVKTFTSARITTATTEREEGQTPGKPVLGTSTLPVASHSDERALSLQQLALLSPSTLPSPHPSRLASEMYHPVRLQLGGGLIGGVSDSDSGASETILQTLTSTRQPELLATSAFCTVGSLTSIALALDALVRNSADTAHQPAPVARENESIQVLANMLRTIADMETSGTLPQRAQEVVLRLREQCTRLVQLLQDYTARVNSVDELNASMDSAGSEGPAVKQLRTNKRHLRRQWEAVAVVRAELLEILRVV